MNESSIKKMKELGEKLREASRAYYQEDREIMSNVEYDALYDTLSALHVLEGKWTAKVAGFVLLDWTRCRKGRNNSARINSTGI